MLSLVFAPRVGDVEEGCIAYLVSFEPDIVLAQLDGTQLRLQPDQSVISQVPIATSR